MPMSMPSTNQISGTVILAVATGTAIYLWNRNRSKRTWRAVATVSELKLYPIKSCKYVKVNKIHCQKDGAKNKELKIRDRSFILCYHTGQMITARQQPSLVLVTPNVLSNGSLELTAPGMNSVIVSLSEIRNGPRFKVRVWRADGSGVDCGKEVGDWFKNYLKLDEDVRLLYHDKSGPAFQRDELLKYAGADVYTEDLVHATFQDYAPINLLSESSVEDLKSRVNISVSQRNFRPNIFVVGCAAYEEDEWRYIKIGSTEMKFIKHCSRCIFTTVDPDVGKKNENMEPLNTLKGYRMVTTSPEKHVYKASPILANDFVPVRSGDISVGDTVYVSV